MRLLTLFMKERRELPSKRDVALARTLARAFTPPIFALAPLRLENEPSQIVVLARCALLLQMARGRELIRSSLAGAVAKAGVEPDSRQRIRRSSR